MPTRGFYQFVAKDPEAACLVAGNVVRTRGEVLERVYQIANGLRSFGLGKGDHICLILQNRPEFIEIIAGSGISGTYVTAVNWHLSAEEVAYVVNDCDSSLVFLDVENAAVGMEAIKRSSNVKKVISVNGDIEGATPFEEWLGQHSSDPPEDEVAGGQMLYSSGTTGLPKGVERSPYSEDPDTNFEIGDQLRALFPTPDEGSWLVTGPLYHAAPYGYTMAAFHRGSKIVVTDAFDPNETLDLIEQHQIDSVHLVPTMFHRLLDLPEDRKKSFDSSSLVMALHGAAPCPIETKRAMIDWWGPVIWEYYGATEGGLTLVSPQEWLERPGTVGKSLPLWEVIVIGEDGREVPPGESGIICFRSLLGRTFEYYKDPAKTERAHPQPSVFTLGDIGHIDEEGYVFLTDRSSDVIISGGVNIYPAEVEACLQGHPAVADVAVIGVPHADWGEEVKAIVQLIDGVEPSEELALELIQFASDRIARFKCPRSVEFEPMLPRTDTGKLYKRRLRERYWAEAGRSI